MKPATREEKAHMSRVSALGCIVCKNEYGVFSPAELHHMRAGIGMAMRTLTGTSSRYARIITGSAVTG